MAKPAGRRTATSNYGPLVPAALISLLLLAVLPSALGIPQTNPSETLEFAPVPPKDDSVVDPPLGNLSSLGLASGEGFSGDGALGGEGGGGVPDPRGAGKNPRTKQCVGNPPRQTEDPLSPPCVGFFNGDNFGSTYKGVTQEEVRVLFYFDGGYVQASSGSGSDDQIMPIAKYVDLAEPATEEEDAHTRTLRVLQRYFNERYQTYNRFVHFFIYFGNGINSHNTEGRRADAYDNYNKIKPFAVFPVTQFFSPDAYLETMASFGVLNFGTFGSRPQSFFQKFPKLIWGYQPSVEQQAQTFAGHICTKVVNKPVSFGVNNSVGGPRRLGLIRTTDAAQPGMQLFARRARELITECGGNFVAEATFPSAGYLSDTRYTPDYASAGMARFAQEGVTTVIWAQGYERYFSTAAANINYRPEWVIAGDSIHETNDRGQAQEQSVWEHAWVVTTTTRTPAADQRQCFQAAREAEPSFHAGDVAFACAHYDNLRQLFVGIQVAGPRLNPESIDKGFRAIPAVPSKTPFVPACFYEPGDYTCVKDATVAWYDPAARSSSTSSPGCWRMPQGGLRYTARTWPEGDVPAQRDSAKDPCNTLTTGSTFRTGTPGS